MLLKIFRFCLNAKQEFNEKVQEFDLTFSQWQVLKAINLSDNQELTLNEIVTILNSDKATISLIVKKLREKEMLISKTKESDKRKIYLSLTKDTQKKCLNFKKVEDEFQRKLFSDLDPNEIEILNKIISKL